MSRLKVITLIALFVSLGCGQIGQTSEEKREYATWQAEQYPWAFYSINENSKRAICEALELSTDDDFCREGTEVKHQDVVEKVQEIFPINQVSYDEVKNKLQEFPNSIEESRQPDGTLVGIRHVYRLTGYKGACIYFQINPDDGKTIEEISGSNLGTAPGPTTCGPSE